MAKIFIAGMCFEITDFRLHPHPRGADELKGKKFVTILDFMNEYLPEHIFYNMEYLYFWELKTWAKIKNNYRSLCDYGHVTPTLSCVPKVIPRETQASTFSSFTKLIQAGEEGGKSKYMLR